MLQVDQILGQLDASVPDNFPTMDHPDNFLASVRLTTYTSKTEWALTIEQLVFATAAGDYYKFRLWVYTYGNFLIGGDGAKSTDTIYPISEGTDGFLFADAMAVRSGIRSVRIRGNLVYFDASPAIFAARRVDLVYPPEIGGWDLLRLLAQDHREQLLATDSERRKRIAQPLPQLLQLDEWYHPDIMLGEKPSDTQCFRMLAEVLATGEPSRYKPTEPPNTDWRNWPRGGTM